MTHVPDLGEMGPVKSVGYLARGYDYPKGETSELVFDRLASLVLLHLMQWFGYHECDLDPCGSNEPQPDLYYREMKIPRSCSTDIIVPDHAAVYQAPSLILHYIRSHRYQPPERFLEAVLACPTPGSEEYFSAIEKAAPQLSMFLTRRPK